MKKLLSLVLLIPVLAFAGTAKVEVDTKTHAVVIEDGSSAIDAKAITLTLGGFTISDASGVKTITLGSTSGTKIGATGDKLGFQGATPIVRPTGNLFSALAAYGLITSPSLTIANITSLQSTLDTEASARAAADTAEASTRAAADSAHSTAIATKANDSATVHNTGNETIAGTKTFSSAPAVPDNSFAESKVANLLSDLSTINSQLSTKAADSTVLHLSGPETVTGAKVFTAAVTAASITFGTGETVTTGGNSLVVRSLTGGSMFYDYGSGGLQYRNRDHAFRTDLSVDDTGAVYVSDLAVGTSATNHSVVFTGDSIFAGNGGTPFSAYMNGTDAPLIADWNGQGPTVNNTAQNGWTINQVMENAVLVNSVFHRESGLNLVVINAVTNNLGNLLYTPPQAYTTAAALAQHFRSLGWKVCIVGMLSRGNALGAPTGPNAGQTWDQLATSYNALLRAGYRNFADDFIDPLAEDPTVFGAAGGYANTTYYTSDQLHPTTAGKIRLAGIVAAHVNNFIARVHAVPPVKTVSVVIDGVTGNIRGGSGIISVSRLGTGNYQLTFSPFTDTNYSISAMASSDGVSGTQVLEDGSYSSRTTSVVRISVLNQNGSAAVDRSAVSVTISGH